MAGASRGGPVEEQRRRSFRVTTMRFVGTGPIVCRDDEAGTGKATRTNGWLLNGYLCPRELKQTMHARGNCRKGYESQPQLSCAVGRRANPIQ